MVPYFAAKTHHTFKGISRSIGGQSSKKIFMNGHVKGELPEHQQIARGELSTNRPEASKVSIRLYSSSGCIVERYDISL